MEAVAAATHGTPYTVVPTKKGFDVELDIVNAQWWELFARAGMRKSFRWRVTEKRDGRAFTITDREVDLTWRAGVPSLSGGAVLQSAFSWSDGFSWSFQSGRIVSFSRQKIWALSDRGRIEPVVDYRFNSREGRDLIRLVGKQLGLKEHQPLVIRLSVAAALATPLGFAVVGLVTMARQALGH